MFLFFMRNQNTLIPDHENSVELDSNSLLFAILKEERVPRLQEEAIWTLWRRKDPAAVPHLREIYLNSRHERVRAKALKVLGWLDPDSSKIFVLPVLKNRKEKTIVKQAAIAVLGSLSEDWALEALCKQLKKREVALRLEAVRALRRHLRRSRLGEVSLKWIVAFLIRAVKKDENQEVRTAAMQALLYVRLNEVETLLYRVLEDCHWPVRCAAMQCLAQMCLAHAPQDSSKAMEALGRCLQMIPRTDPMNTLLHRAFDTVLARSVGFR